jgi:hypothetical protein
MQLSISQGDSLNAQVKSKRMLILATCIYHFAIKTNEKRPKAGLKVRGNRFKTRFKFSGFSVE